MTDQIPAAAPVDEVAVLFAEEKVGPYTLRPWTLAQFGQLLGLLMKLLENFVASGINFETEDFTPALLQRMLPLVTPLFPEIIAVTLRLAPAAVAEIPMGLQMALGLRILLNKQNQEETKNFYAGFLGAKSPAIPTPTP